MKSLKKKNLINLRKKFRKFSSSNKKILILGLGREGLDNFRFFRKLFPKKVIEIGDKAEEEDKKKKIKRLFKNDRRIRFYLGEDYLDSLKNADLIIKSPGIPPRVIKPYLKRGQVVTSQTEIFFDNCPGEIIGVTGTKGKGTTVSLIYSILKEGGLRVHLVGNIGKPVLSFLESSSSKDIFVYELSSHQLSQLKKSPHIAVLLNISPAHLDYYKNFKEYVETKINIVRYQKKNDYLIYNKLDNLVRRVAKLSKGVSLTFALKPKSDCYIEKGFIRFRKEKIIKTRDIPLIGDHNLLNVMAAVIVGKIMNIENEKIEAALKKFKPLYHRLEYIGTKKGIKFYNDSLATTPGSTIAALKALGDDIQTIILGGYDANVNFKNLAKEILKSKIKNLILFPPSGDKIWREIISLKKKRTPNSIMVQSMKDAVQIAFKYTKEGKICLLSCASPSFGLFKNYKERGNLFKKYVKKYGR